MGLDHADKLSLGQTLHGSVLHRHDLVARFHAKLLCLPRDLLDAERAVAHDGEAEPKRTSGEARLEFRRRLHRLRLRYHFLHPCLGLVLDPVRGGRPRAQPVVFVVARTECE